MDTNIKIAQSKVNTYLCAQWNRRLIRMAAKEQEQVRRLSTEKRLAT
jgi:hypothetical protein